MPMDLSQIGREIGPNEIRWTPDECILYALGVGAGATSSPSPPRTPTACQRVLPTFVTTVGRGGGAGQVDALSFGTYGAHQVVHASHKVELHRALSSEGRALATMRVAGIWDKRAGALVELETTARDPSTGEVMFRNIASLFVLGEGGFGGPHGPVIGGPRHPAREPDHTICEVTRPEQALIYRLCGDHNRIHSDPAVARRSAFERPILHGLCSFGYAGRALLNAVCAGDPARFRSMSPIREAGLRRPLTRIWVDRETALRHPQPREALLSGRVHFAKP
jgi:hypothetical protein